jgi:hypothetical protein
MCVAQVEIAASSSSQRLKSTTVYLVGLVNIDVFWCHDNALFAVSAGLIFLVAWVRAGEYVTSLCRVCKEDREETHHLFAHCCGLSHLRMRILGRSYLDEPFQWTPHLLLSMASAIERIYPEEKRLCNSNQTLIQPRQGSMVRGPKVA